MSDVSYYTKEGLENLKEEVRLLETVERPKISQQIAEARDKGDLSENAEYDAAKEAQGLLELRISKLKNTLANARLIDDSNIDNSKVFILSKVTIKNVKNSMQMTYTLVAENEANFIGIMAAIHSKNQFVSYSGNISALKYLLNELYKTDKLKFDELFVKVNRGVIKNINQANKQLEQYKYRKRHCLSLYKSLLRIVFPNFNYTISICV